jgi:peptidoglycan/xylan/chitin deacetylase (PgdA/CDA1 family)
MNGFIPVLLYHSVADDRVSEDRFAVSPAMFESHVDAIEASGRVTLTMGELADCLRGERPLPERAAAVTFDDGFADNAGAAMSLLSRGLRSTLYITTGELGAPDRLTPSLVGELADAPGIEIGAHGVRHRYLDELGERELAHEVSASRAALEDMIRTPVHSFAYPHGGYDRRVRAAVIDAGYRCAAAVKNALAHPAEDPFAIARWTVTRDVSAARIALVLAGHAVPLSWSRERVRTRAYRMVRRQRRRVARVLKRDDS